MIFQRRLLPALRLVAMCAGVSIAITGLQAAQSPDGQAEVRGWWQGLLVSDLSGGRIVTEARWYVVVFLGQDCPVSNSYIPVLNQLARDFSSRDFLFVGAYVDQTVPLSQLLQHSRDYGLEFVAADDRLHRLVKLAKATYTPEAAVFSRTGELIYAGRIDDRVGTFGAARPAATHEDLREVLQRLLHGERGPFKAGQGFGCAIPEIVNP